MGKEPRVRTFKVDDFGIHHGGWTWSGDASDLTSEEHEYVCNAIAFEVDEHRNEKKNYSRSQYDVEIEIDPEIEEEPFFYFTATDP